MKKLYIAIPLMDELHNLPVLLQHIEQQDYKWFKVFFCVNQPDSWWDSSEKKEVCERNVASLKYLLAHAPFPYHVIDKCSPGRGWQGKQFGVGWARKIVMDALLSEAGSEDIIITLDADTAFNAGYFRSVLDSFNANRKAVGLSVPYYHRLSGSEAEDRSVLRYEIYMRNYAINLWRIGNPYHFTALGSAMAVPVKSYKAIGGMSPKKSGEDFYFLQKLTKYGQLMTWNEEKVYPAARFSDRVFFGTGPAMIKGATGNWDSYPIYHHSLFDQIHVTYLAFDELFVHQVETPMDGFVKEVFRQEDIWTALRINSKTIEQFRRACRDKIDGLRILQFLKSAQQHIAMKDEDCLLDYLETYQKDNFNIPDFIRKDFTFDELNVAQLNMIRDILVEIEEQYQKSHQYA
jgi:hypothetical protein